MNLAERQNRLKPCEINDILSRISVSFRKTADRQIIQIFHSIHLDLVPVAAEGQSLKISLAQIRESIVCYREGDTGR